MINWRSGVVLVGLLGVLLVAVPASAGLADRAGATFGLMAEAFIKAFEPTDALVIQIEGERVYLDIGEGRAQIGQEYTIYRKGDVFRHPLTGKPLGRYEDTLGYAQVKRVQPRFSEAAFIPLSAGSRPAPEDGARITRGRIRVAVTPVLDLTRSDADLRRVPYMLGVTLERAKRFQVVDPLSVSDVLASVSVRVEEVLARPERATRAAKSLEIAAWLVPVVLERNGVTYLDVTWISAITGTPLFSRREPLLPASTVEEQRFPWEPRAED